MQSKVTLFHINAQVIFNLSHENFPLPVASIVAKDVAYLVDIAMRFALMNGRYPNERLGKIVMQSYIYSGKDGELRSNICKGKLNTLC